jgi:hypothetical protein
MKPTRAPSPPITTMAAAMPRGTPRPSSHLAGGTQKVASTSATMIGTDTRASRVATVSSTAAPTSTTSSRHVHAAREASQLGTRVVSASGHRGPVPPDERDAPLGWRGATLRGRGGPGR